MRRVTRRRFLGQSAQSLLGLSAGSLLRGGAPAEKLLLAAVGIGGRGSTLVRGFAARPDAEFAYVCDLDPRRGGDLMMMSS